MGRVDGGPYIKSPSNGKFIEVDAERGDYVLTTDVMGYVANTYDMYIGANIEETDITKIKEAITEVNKLKDIDKINNNFTESEYISKSYRIYTSKGQHPNYEIP